MIDDVWQGLAEGVIMQAVYDWRKLVKKGAHSGCYTELRLFFRSEWCATLCGGADPILILGLLEKERKLAESKKKEAH